MSGKRKLSDVFRSTFDTPDGRTMLYWIASECGCFQGDPAKVRPELMAFWNRLMAVGGVISPSKAGSLMEHMMIVASQPGNDTRSEDEAFEI